MSNYNNEFNIGGTNNTVNITQTYTDGNNEALQMILKFLITLILSPVLIPAILAMNGYKLMQGEQNLLGGYDDGDE
jgi:CheY-like chemotaxis protein